MTQDQHSKEVVIEIPQIEKAVWSRIWKKMRSGEALQGREIYIGRSMADHPNWFPLFETLDVLGGDDTLPDGSNPFVHLNFHTLVGSQVFAGQPKAAQDFYRIRTKKGDSPHDAVHLLIAIFQAELQRMARRIARNEQTEFDWSSYVKRLRTLGRIPTRSVWVKLGFKSLPDTDHFHRAPQE